MKKTILTLSILALPYLIIGQSSTATNIRGAATFLGYFGGVAGPLDIRNDFLTPNAHIRFFTGGVPTTLNERVLINANVPAQPTTGPAGPQNTSGFVGIGLNPTVQAPWSRLHVGVPSGPAINAAFGGYRPWMPEGITIQRANDQMWLGHRQWGATVDRQNAVVNWGDDALGPAGPDHLIFNFTQSTFGGPYAVPGVLPNPQELNGLEMMRLTDLGRVGIGPRFSNVFVPQNQLHQHQENSSPSFFQISNQGSAVNNNPITNVTAPTNITATDGLKMGIDDVNNAYLYNQENRPLMFSTNNFPPGYGSGHRMLITNIASLTQPAGGLNPGGLPANLTRVSISHDPLNPLTRPLSLLHLGYNTSYFFPGPLVGWRPWMDIGMLVTANGFSDHVYLGLKNEAGLRNDAVLSWGFNDKSQVPALSPNRYRIVFTSPVVGQAAAGVGASSTLNGLEFERYVPNTLAGNTIADPRIGIGNFYSLAPGGNTDPNNTVEINTQLGAGGNFGALNPGFPIFPAHGQVRKAQAVYDLEI